MEQKRIRNSLRAEREKLKAMTPRQRWEFIWEYYWPWILGTALVLILTAYSLWANWGTKESVLYVAMLNPDREETSVFSDWLRDAGYDPAEQEVGVERYFINYDHPDTSSVTTLQTLSALFGMGNMDLFLADERGFGNFAVASGFEDLRTLLPSDFLDSIADRVYVVQTNSGKYCAAGIRLPADSPLVLDGTFPEGTIAGVVSNTENRAAAAACLLWLAAGNEK